jgi:hypothetical protein
MPNKTPIEAYKESKLKEFSKKFPVCKVVGKLKLKDGDVDLRGRFVRDTQELPIEIKQFLSSALDGLVSQIREEVETKRIVSRLNSHHILKGYVKGRNDVLGESKGVVLSVLNNK